MYVRSPRCGTHYRPITQPCFSDAWRTSSQLHYVVISRPRYVQVTFKELGRLFFDSLLRILQLCDPKPIYGVAATWPKKEGIGEG
jgi:hypothetical protein